MKIEELVIGNKIMIRTDAYNDNGTIRNQIKEATILRIYHNRWVLLQFKYFKSSAFVDDLLSDKIIWI